MSIIDEKYMQLALEIANKSHGFHLPNPKVGCVIVRGKEVIGQGYHAHDGAAHAEVNAINDALNRTKDLSDATLYVTLTPCSKPGRTGACVALIVQHKFHRVVVATTDLSDDAGIALLQREGIKVTTGILEADAYHANRIFFHNVVTRSPYVAIKIASTLDGYVATANYDSKWITSEEMRNYARQKRSEFQAILIGANTLRLDDPELNTRLQNYANPKVVILVTQPVDFSRYKLFRSKIQKYIFVFEKTEKLAIENAEFIEMNSHNFDINTVLRELWNRNIKSLLVEGGPFTYNEFLRAKAVQEVHLYYGNKILGDAASKKMLDFQKIKKMNEALELTLYSCKTIDNQIALEWGVNKCLPE